MQTGFSGGSAIGKRLRKLSSLIDQDAKRVYQAQGIEFEQRWFGLLNQLILNGPMSVKDIASALGITHVSVSEARKSLEAKKLIRATPDKADKRQRLLSLTQKGQTLIARLYPVWQALDDASEELNSETEDIAAALDRLSAALERKSLLARTIARLS